MERKRKLLAKAKGIQLLRILGRQTVDCDGIHHLHCFTKDEDKVLIHYQRRGDQEEVGDGKMKEGNRAQQICCGDEGHLGLARLVEAGGIDTGKLFSVLSSRYFSHLEVEGEKASGDVRVPALPVRNPTIDQAPSS